MVRSHAMLLCQRFLFISVTDLHLYGRLLTVQVMLNDYNLGDYKWTCFSVKIFWEDDGTDQVISSLLPTTSHNSGNTTLNQVISCLGHINENHSSNQVDVTNDNPHCHHSPIMGIKEDKDEDNECAKKIQKTNDTTTAQNRFPFDGPTFQLLPNEETRE